MNNTLHNRIKRLKDDINYIQKMLEDVESIKDHTIDTETPARALRSALRCMKHELYKLTKGEENA